MKNPFEVTKAVDFTDEEIAENFVAYPNGGYKVIADPASPMSQFLVGGKGGGRTHLMRQLSYSLQRTRSERALAQIQDDGYIGIYFRCSGLNGTRFRGRGIDPEAWESVFSYYMDVWLSEHLLEALADIEAGEESWVLEKRQAFVRRAAPLASYLDTSDKSEHRVVDIYDEIVKRRKAIDRAINNAGLTGKLELSIETNPGELVFALGRAASETLPGMEKVVITFMLDEYENLDLRQQMYVNTLLREKELPTSFLIGARTWGVRTQASFSAQEENKRGNEFEWIQLEDAYNKDPNSYEKFCLELTATRLREAGLTDYWESNLRRAFASAPQRRFADMRRKLKSPEPQHIQRLRSQLQTGPKSRSDIDAVITRLVYPEDLVIQKLTLLKFYQSWNLSKVLTQAVIEEAEALRADLLSPKPSATTQTFRQHWEPDMVHQLNVESRIPASYTGFDQFVKMSGGLPRTLLMILKYVYRWEVFSGADPFTSDHLISIESQTRAVTDAAQWYSVNSLPEGDRGDAVSAAIIRLSSFFSRYRLSDKPSEVMAVSFSSDLQDLTSTARQCLADCVDHGLLLELQEGRAARNNGSTWRKYQLHPMIAPLYGLPTGVRGSISIKGPQLEAFFGNVGEARYSVVASKMLGALNGPFGFGEYGHEALF